MFRKTHMRLTWLNSLVFIVLISTLGSIIYFYTENNLYHNVNESIREAIDRFHNPPEFSRYDNGQSPLFFKRDRDPRNMFLIWNGANELLVQQNREAELFQGDEELIRPKKLNSFQDVKIGNFTFRYMATKVDTNFGKMTFQVIRNINSEKEFLDRLLLIIVLGCGVGILCAIASGYFLAGRALVPIKNAWQKQQEFVSDASHELRTPLAVIQAKTEVLFRSPAATIQEKSLDVSTISTESRRLSKLVGNLLTLARSDSDQMEMNKQTFSLDELLKEIALQFEEIISYQGKTLRLEAKDPLMFLADKERIHQLIVILLDNAMKFTNEGDEILLSCEQSHHSIHLRIHDSGIGIAEEDIPKIFDRFYQTDKSRTRAEGTGLGLSIAKWIIDKHHGKVKVISQLEEGTTIDIHFPKGQK